MSTSKTQKHIDSAGRLAGIIRELCDDSIQQIDVLEWCVQVNVVLDNDTKTPGLAVKQIVLGELR